MNVLEQAFSLFCHQNPLRSFVIDGQVLPFCERCAGVYLGVGISAICLLLSRRYGRTMPARGIIWLSALSMALMPVFGFHLLDPGSAWRFWSGLLFGNGLALLMVPAARLLISGRPPGMPDRRSQWIRFVALFAFLNTMPLWFPLQSDVFYYGVLILAFIGLLCIVICPAAVVLAVLRSHFLRLLSKGAAHEQSPIP